MLAFQKAVTICIRRILYYFIRNFLHAGKKQSWTAKLLANQNLLCSKIREEAGELCQTLEEDEGKARAASEMADLLYHSMVLLNLQVRLLSLASVHLMVVVHLLDRARYAYSPCIGVYRPGL